MAGALKTLFTMLSQSQYITGNNVSIVFGEEEVNDQSKALPMVVMVPRGGSWEVVAGYAKNTDSNIEQTWGCREEIDLYLWAADSSPTALPIDHADAIESLVGIVLSTFQDQRMNQGFDATSGGLYYIPRRGEWTLMQGAFNRFGRAYKLTVAVDKTVDMLPPPELTNPVFPLTATINVPA